MHRRELTDDGLIADLPGALAVAQCPEEHVRTQAGLDIQQMIRAHPIIATACTIALLGGFIFIDRTSAPDPLDRVSAQVLDDKVDIDPLLRLAVVAQELDRQVPLVGIVGGGLDEPRAAWDGDAIATSTRVRCDQFATSTHRSSLVFRVLDPLGRARDFPLPTDQQRAIAAQLETWCVGAAADSVSVRIEPSPFGGETITATLQNRSNRDLYGIAMRTQFNGLNTTFAPLSTRPPILIRSGEEQMLLLSATDACSFSVKSEYATEGTVFENSRRGGNFVLIMSSSLDGDAAESFVLLTPFEREQVGDAVREACIKPFGTRTP